MEGLAELAVKENCGEAYNATWCHLYDEEEIKQFWETELKEYLHVKKQKRNMMIYCTVIDAIHALLAIIQVFILLIHYIPSTKS